MVSVGGLACPSGLEAPSVSLPSHGLVRVPPPTLCLSRHPTLSQGPFLTHCLDSWVSSWGCVWEMGDGFCPVAQGRRVATLGTAFFLAAVWAGAWELPTSQGWEVALGGPGLRAGRQLQAGSCGLLPMGSVAWQAGVAGFWTWSSRQPAGLLATHWPPPVDDTFVGRGPEVSTGMSMWGSRVPPAGRCSGQWLRAQGSGQTLHGSLRTSALP